MYNPVTNPLARGFFGTRRPRVIAHRGSSGTHPENTLVSFQKGVDVGADILEMDIHLTADGQIVVIHDPTVDRTTNGAGTVASKTLADLKVLDAGFRFTPDGGITFPFRGKGVKIPTLEEVLDAFPQMPMNVEIKANDPKLIAGFLELLEKRNRYTDVMVLVAAEAAELMAEVRSQQPLAVTGHCSPEVKRFLACSLVHLPWLFKPKAPAMQVPYRRGWFRVVTPTFVRHAHTLGMEVHVWTINEEDDMIDLLQMGADALFTDFPGRMRKLVDSGKWKYRRQG